MTQWKCTMRVGITHTDCVHRGHRLTAYSNDTDQTSSKYPLLPLNTVTVTVYSDADAVIDTEIGADAESVVYTEADTDTRQDTDNSIGTNTVIAADIDTVTVIKTRTLSLRLPLTLTV